MRREGFVQADGAQIHFCAIGQGKPVVFLHGNGENYKVFRQQAVYFKMNYRLVFIDSRGHGQSSMGKEDLNFDRMAEDVVRVLEHLKINKAAFVGFSDGANLGINIALKYPSYVEKLAAVSGNINPHGMDKKFYYTIKGQYKVFDLLSKIHPFFNRKKQLYSLMLFHPRISFGSLAEIKAPVLVVAGDRDMIKDSHTRAIAAAIPDARLKIIKDAGHMGIFNKADEYNQVIEEFLSGTEHFQKGTEEF